jgi:hypothetical protein
MTHKEAWAERNAIWKATEEEKDRHKKALEELEARMAQLKKICPHEEVYSYSGTPYDSGGYSCEVTKDFGFDKPQHSRVV